jgi:hypothetical protein
MDRMNNKTKEDKMKEITIELYETLKDILNAADNGQPYSAQELESFRPALNAAYEAGIRGNGEE